MVAAALEVHCATSVRERRRSAVAHFAFLAFTARVASADEACLVALRRLCEGFITGPRSTVDDELEIRPAPDTEGRPCYGVYRQGTLVALERTPESAASRTEWELCTAAIRQCAHGKGLLHFHAAAVARDGIAVLFPAASGAGKSTLALALLARGFALLGDDVSFIEERTGVVLPFWRRLHLDVQSIALLAKVGVRYEQGRPRQHAFPPSAFGLRLPVAPAPLRLVILPDRESLPPGALVRVEQSEMAAAMLPHSATLRQGDNDALGCVERLLNGCACFRLGTGSLEMALDAIDCLVASLGSSQQR